MANGSNPTCSVIALHKDDFISDLGHIAAATRTHIYNAGPIANAPKQANLHKISEKIYRMERTFS